MGSFERFTATADRIAPYELSNDDILEKVKACADAGGTQVMVQGGLAAHHTMETYVTW